MKAPETLGQQEKSLERSYALYNGVGVHVTWYRRSCKFYKT